MGEVGWALGAGGPSTVLARNLERSGKGPGAEGGLGVGSQSRGRRHGSGRRMTPDAARWRATEGRWRWIWEADRLGQVGRGWTMKAASSVQSRWGGRSGAGQSLWLGRGRWTACPLTISVQWDYGAPCRRARGVAVAGARSCSNERGQRGSHADIGSQPGPGSRRGCASYEIGRAHV